ncbi:hypothetical protein [Streptomyces sp. NPDC088762]|uniref:hypothetical protein n=1 Tax=Streptomyces sp. NPDC088762 TaxID=3365891 RepID=UPI00381BA5F2
MAHTMVVAVSPTDLDRLDALVQEQQAAETRWQARAEQDANLLGLRGPELRAARTRIRAERDRLRENGRHRISRLLALAPALRTELEHRGLLREWDPIPEGAQRAGQTLGGAGPYSGYRTHRPTRRQHHRGPLGTAPARGLLDQPASHPSPGNLERRVGRRTCRPTGHILRTALHHTLNSR